MGDVVCIGAILLRILDLLLMELSYQVRRRRTQIKVKQSPPSRVSLRLELNKGKPHDERIYKTGGRVSVHVATALSCLVLLLCTPHPRGNEQTVRCMLLPKVYISSCNSYTRSVSSRFITSN